MARREPIHADKTRQSLAILVIFTLGLSLIFPASWADAQEKGGSDENTNELSPGNERGPPTRETITREEMHRWDRHIRGFRSEHNFALTSGLSSGIWHVKKLGPLRGRDFSGSGVFTRFQYSFHLQLYQGFGYFLGSGVGYHYESYDKRRAFRPTPSAQFPGLLAGLTLNVNPMFRASVSLDTYLERHDGIEAEEGGETANIYVTIQTFDAGAYVDLFYDLVWALRIEAHRRYLTYIRPDLPDEKAASYPVNASLGKDDEWVGVGIVFHLL